MRLRLGDTVWTGERRGKAVFVRRGSGVPRAHELKDEAAAQAFLEAQRDALLAKGYQVEDEQAGLDTPPKVTTETLTLPKRFEWMGPLAAALVKIGHDRKTLEENARGWVEDALRNERRERAHRRRETMDADARILDEHLEAVTEREAAEAAVDRSRVLETLLEIMRGERRNQRARTKPDPCINERLDAAFDELSGSGMVALQAVGGTVLEGWDDVSLAIARRVKEGEQMIGGVWYGDKAALRAIAGRGLQLSFGDWSRIPLLEVGQRVFQCLQKHHVPATWKGTVADAITLEPFEWYRLAE